MPDRPAVWLVVSDEQPVAELEVETLDPPWFCGHVILHRGFWRLQALFDREQGLATRVHHDPAAWAAACRKVRREVQLIRPDGHEAPEFTLYIAGRRARWRCWKRESIGWLAEQRVATRSTPRARQRTGLSLSAAMLGALTAMMMFPGLALGHPLQHLKSANWAGYAVTTARPFHSVSGRWVQPRAKCDHHTSTYAAFWVGLGGLKTGSEKLEQIGSESDCDATGHATSYAWYELVPHPSVRVGMKIDPGDRIAAEVSLHGDLVRLRIQNLTSHRTFAKTIRFATPDTSSAEWIAEAPSQCVDRQCQPLPLTDFGSVQFAGVAATANRGHTGTITDPAFTTTELTLSPGAAALGPPPPPPPGPGAQPASPTPVSPTASGGATPSRPWRHGAAFAVKFTPANSSPRPQPTNTLHTDLAAPVSAGSERPGLPLRRLGLQRAASREVAATAPRPGGAGPGRGEEEGHGGIGAHWSLGARTRLSRAQSPWQASDYLPVLSSWTRMCSELWRTPHDGRFWTNSLSAMVRRSSRFVAVW